MFLQLLQVFQTFAAYSLLFFVFSIGALLKPRPLFRDVIVRAFDAVTRTKLPVASYWESLFSDQMFQNVWHSVELDLYKKIKEGCKAPDTPVVSLSAKHCFSLLKMAKPGRPLVLNFGSCTCPIFMSQLDAFQKMVNDFSQVADFCVVYIEEAHPSDGWALKVTLISSSRKRANSKNHRKKKERENKKTLLPQTHSQHSSTWGSLKRILSCGKRNTFAHVNFIFKSNLLFQCYWDTR